MAADWEVSEHFPIGCSYGLVASRCFRDDEADIAGFFYRLIEVLATLCGVVDDVAKGEVFYLYPLLPVLACLCGASGHAYGCVHARADRKRMRNLTEKVSTTEITEQ